MTRPAKACKIVSFRLTSSFLHLCSMPVVTSKGVAF